MLVLEPRAGLFRMPQLRLVASHLGVRAIERALGGVHRVARLIVRCARRLQAALQAARLGVLGLELVANSRHLRGMLFAFRRGIAAAQVPEEMLLELQIVLQILVASGDLRLGIELLNLRAELEADIGDPREVLARVGEAGLGFLAALLVLRDAGGFLEEDPQLFGLRLDDPRDHPLLDDGVGARPEARAKEHVGDVAAAHVHAVDVVARLAVALDDALDGDFGVLRPLAGRPAKGIVEAELDRSTRERRTVRRAVEDHVLHRVAAQGRGAALAEHPAHRIDHVRFTAAVRANYADQLAGDVNRCGIYEGLKTGQLDLS